MPSHVAFLFPGQGRIPEELPSNSGQFSHLLALAHNADLPLETWIQSGQVDRLAQTDAAQPTLFFDSICREQLLRDTGWRPAYVAGHSLGEYAALVSACVLTDSAAMTAVIERGRLMNDVDGTMAAILKLDLATVAELCVDTEAVVANHNAETQIIVSGPENAVRAVMQRAESAGGRALPLKVSGPFHSPLMAPAQQSLAPLLKRLEFAPPKLHIISGVSGSLETDTSSLKQLLLRQMTSPVHWLDVSRELERLGIEIAVEVGSGDVLTRLGRRSGSAIRFLTFEEAIHEDI